VKASGMANYGDHQLSITCRGCSPTPSRDHHGSVRLGVPGGREPVAEAMGYIVPSAGSGSTARANLAAFEKWRLVPGCSAQCRAGLVLHCARHKDAGAVVIARSAYRRLRIQKANWPPRGRPLRSG